MSFQSDGVFERGWVDFQDGGSFSCFFGWLGVGLKVVGIFPSSFLVVGVVSRL